MITRLEDVLGDARSAVIVGHTRPDGDCMGSTLAVSHYLKEAAPQIKTTVVLESFHRKFLMMPGAENAVETAPPAEEVDLLIVCDCSTPDRIGAGRELADSGIRTVVIDHHLTGGDFGDAKQVVPDASSTCEVLFDLMDKTKISRDCAACLYVGILHDTGVFRHSCTKPSTLRMAADLMEKGAPFTEIQDKTFFSRSYVENHITGYVLEHSQLLHNDEVLFGSTTLEEMERFGAGLKDIDGIVAQLNLTENVRATVYLYETAPGVFKCSFRSDPSVRVSDTAAAFGGGGHAQAAGCSLAMPLEQAKEAVLNELYKQL